jgi:hypothetical protein
MEKGLLTSPCLFFPFTFFYMKHLANSGGIVKNCFNKKLSQHHFLCGSLRLVLFIHWVFLLCEDLWNGNSLRIEKRKKDKNDGSNLQSFKFRALQLQLYGMKRKVCEFNINCGSVQTWPTLLIPASKIAH